MSVVPMSSVLEAQLEGVKELIRREHKRARVENRKANVTGLSATARGLKARITREQERTT
jgi:hypothetical protein